MSSLSKSLLSVTRQVAKVFLKTSKQGAQTTIHCATADEVVNQSGLYFEYEVFLLKVV